MVSLRQLNRERKILFFFFNKWCATLRYPQQQNDFTWYLTPHTRISSKWITDLNVRAERLVWKSESRNYQVGMAFWLYPEDTVAMQSRNTQTLLHSQYLGKMKTQETVAKENHRPLVIKVGVDPKTIWWRLGNWIRDPRIEPLLFNWQFPLLSDGWKKVKGY